MAQVNYSDNGLIFITKSTFSSVSSVSIDNCFSADYSQYKIIIDASGPSVNQINMRMRASGSDNSSADYNVQFVGTSGGTSVIAARNASTTSFEVVTYSRANSAICLLEILNPYQSTYTSGLTITGLTPETTSLAVYTRAYGMDVTTSYDGLTLLPDTSTFSGTVYVYGYVGS